MNEPRPWEAPWLRPTGRIAQEAFAALDRPLKAWATGDYFDASGYYSEFKAHDLSAVERDVRAAGRRAEWRMEFVWQPDAESSEREDADYKAGVREVAERMIHPRCLEDYASVAYSYAERAGWSDGEYGAPSPPELDSPWFEDALAWADAGVCVMQLSLPWPFVDCLTWEWIDNRPAHRLMYAYASLLQFKHPRKARKWFRAMVFMNPPDNLGVRYHLMPRSKSDADELDDE